MRWLALELPRLPLEVLTRGLETLPALVVREQQQVLLATEPARRTGIRPGMCLATASGLCDQLRVMPRDPAREQRALRLLALRLLDITPEVSLQPPNGLVLDIGGCLKLFRGLEPLLAALDKTLTDSGFTIHTALGPTPLAAWQLTTLPRADSLACCQTADPPAAFRQLLAAQPVDQLRLPEPMRRRLGAPGFATLGELLALPRHTLGKRHGRDLLLWLEKLLGERPDRRPALRPPARFTGEIEFPDPVDHTDGLVFPMQRLLDDLARHLRRHQQSVTAIRWHFRPLDGPPDTLVVQRARPAHDARDWLALTRRKLEHYRLSAPVLELALDTGRPRPRAAGDQALFTDPSERPPREALLEKLATLPSLHLHSPRERDEPLPEAGDETADPLAPAPTHTPTAPPFRDRPLWLLDPPHPLAFRDQTPLWQDAPLEWLPGEERYSSHWWQADNHAREYRIARHPDGFCFWVFRERRSGEWFIQGLF